MDHTNKTSVISDHKTSTKPRWFYPTAVAATFAVLGLGFAGWVSAATTTSSLWSTKVVPQTLTDSDTASVELGVKFQAKVSGQVTGVKFYKSAQNTGTHTGSLWDNNGTRLASVTFTGESSNGWQTATFPQPVTIAANVSYVISYHANGGHYSSTEGYFSSSSHARKQLTANQSTTTNPNGVYKYGTTSGFPTSTYKATNYWVDVLFSSKLVNPVPKPAPPISVKAVAGSGAVNVTWNASISANPIANYLVMRDGSQIASVSGSTLTYADKDVTAGKTYAYQIKAIDNSGVTSDPSNTASVTYNVTPPTPTPPTPTPPTPVPPSPPSGTVPAYGSYVKPGTVGYLGSTSALKVYQPGGAALPGCSWVSYGMRCNDDSLTIDHAWVKGTLYWTGSGTLTVTNTLWEAGQSGSDAWACIRVNQGNAKQIIVKDSTLRQSASFPYNPAGGDIGAVWSSENASIDLERDDISGFPQGEDPTGNSVIDSNYFHDIRDVNGAHRDGIFSQGGNNILIQRNYIDGPAGANVTAALFFQDSGPMTGIKIYANYLAAGPYYNLHNEDATGLDVQNNTFGNEYGAVNDSPGSIGTWSNNKFTSGALVPKP